MDMSIYIINQLQRYGPIASSTKPGGNNSDSLADILLESCLNFCILSQSHKEDLWADLESKLFSIIQQPETMKQLKVRIFLEISFIIFPE